MTLNEIMSRLTTKRRGSSLSPEALWYLELGALGKNQQRRLRRSTPLRKKANQGSTVCLQPCAASHGEGSDHMLQMLRGWGQWELRMITGPGNTKLTGHRDRCGGQKSLTGKCSRVGDTRRGGNRDNSLREFCYEEELQVGQKLRAEWWVEYRFTHISTVVSWKLETDSICIILEFVWYFEFKKSFTWSIQHYIFLDQEKKYQRGKVTCLRSRESDVYATLSHAELDGAMERLRGYSLVKWNAACNKTSWRTLLNLVILFHI